MIPKKKRGRPRKNPETTTKIKRIKVCVCQKEVGRKVRTCPHCGHKFEFKKFGKYEEIKNWQSLQSGDTVILKKGSRGPYYQNESGEKIIMGYRGVFNVKYVQEDGIIAYSPTEGQAFIYMGPNNISASTGIYRRKYKLFKRT